VLVFCNETHADRYHVRKPVRGVTSELEAGAQRVAPETLASLRRLA
jgi:hypothetical protein